MLKGSNCDRKSQFSEILNEPLNPRVLSSLTFHYPSTIPLHPVQPFSIYQHYPYIQFNLYIFIYNILISSSTFQYLSINNILISSTTFQYLSKISFYPVKPFSIYLKYPFIQLNLLVFIYNILVSSSTFQYLSTISLYPVQPFSINLQYPIIQIKPFSIYQQYPYIQFNPSAFIYNILVSSSTFKYLSTISLYPVQSFSIYQQYPYIQFKLSLFINNILILYYILSVNSELK